MCIRDSPNPVDDYVRVAIHDYLPQSASISFYTMDGSLVHQQALRGTAETIDLSHLPPGVYVYELEDKGQRIGGSKLVKL